LLAAFCGSLVWLVAREIRGYRAVNKYLHRTPDLAVLAQGDRQSASKELNQHAATFSTDSFAAHRFRQYQHSVQDDMSAQETVRLYQRMVDEPVAIRAREIVRRESMISGSLAFVSPNHLIQTLTILWISLRMVRRVAQVYGLRPATTGNWRLLTILAQNLAAQSIFDLASDEIANQISGSLTARFVENSAEAVAAGALNVRLGKALIKLLS
jgi:putative membrane protein